MRPRMWSIAESWVTSLTLMWLILRPHGKHGSTHWVLFIFGEGSPAKEGLAPPSTGHLPIRVYSLSSLGVTGSGEGFIIGGWGAGVVVNRVVGGAVIGRASTCCEITGGGIPIGSKTSTDHGSHNCHGLLRHSDEWTQPRGSQLSRNSHRSWKWSVWTG